MGYLVPLLAMARFGELSGKHSKKEFGAGLGAGFMLTGFSLPLVTGFMAPFTICAEASFRRFGIRSGLPLGTYTSVYQTYSGEIPRISTRFYTVKLTYAIVN
jgi:hypothetical protein